MSASLAVRILETLTYSDQFEYPLTAQEIFTRLLQKPTEALELSKKIVEEELLYLIDLKLIGQKGEYYFLSGRKQIVGKRIDRERRALTEFSEAETQAKQLLSLIPTVQAVVVTGSVAVYSPRKNDDLDLMILTRPGTIWLTRLLVVFLTSILGRRRYWWEDDTWLNAKQDYSVAKSKYVRANNKKSKNSIVKKRSKSTIKWCLNLWLSTDSMKMPEAKKSYYLAYELLQSRFIYDAGGVEARFLEKNEWVASVLPRYYQSRKKMLLSSKRGVHRIVSTISFYLFRPVFFLVDVVSYLSQRIYMSQHMSREIVTRHRAYFHPRPTQSLVVSGWKQSIERWRDQIASAHNLPD